jgi:hypothetical protein
MFTFFIFPDAEKIHVKYFNWNGFTAHLPAKNVFQFGEMEDFWKELTEVRKIKKTLVKSFTKSCFRAIEEAKFFMTVPEEHRLNLIDTLVFLQKKFKKQNINDINFDQEVPPELLEYVVPFFKIMKEYDDRIKAIPKKVVARKSSTVSDTISEKSFDSSLTRHSSREIRKRKLENIDSFGVDKYPKQENFDLHPPQKKRKLEVASSETLEERFLMKDPNLSFRNLPRKKICAECCSIKITQEKNEETYRCSGKCAGWFHKSCSGSFQLIKEQLVHQTGDLEEIDTNAETSVLFCKSCHEGVTKCFVCRELIDESLGSVKCSNFDCKLVYHKKCLENYPQTGHGAKANFLCPQHCCHMCYSIEINKTGKLARVSHSLFIY